MTLFSLMFFGTAIIALVGTAAAALDLRSVEPKKTSWFSRLLKERAR